MFLLVFVVCTSVGGGDGGGAGGEMRTSKDHNIGSFTQGLC